MTSRDDVRRSLARAMPRGGWATAWDEGHHVHVAACWGDHAATAKVSRRRIESADDPLGVIVVVLDSLRRDVAEMAGGCGLAPIAAERLDGMVML